MLSWADISSACRLLAWHFRCLLWSASPLLPIWKGAFVTRLGFSCRRCTECGVWYSVLGTIRDEQGAEDFTYASAALFVFRGHHLRFAG